MSSAHWVIYQPSTALVASFLPAVNYTAVLGKKISSGSASGIGYNSATC